MERRQKSRFLALIHIARGILILPIPIAVYSQFRFSLSNIPPGVDIYIVAPFVPIVFLAILAIIEFYNANQLLSQKLEDLLVPLITMFLVVLIELIIPIGLSVVDKYVLAIHICFVIGLSVVEIGLVVLSSVG